ncbi:hypothetical protein [Salinicoccus sp. YB14-2]|uniref:hypothetical protein n=1 Tax=Salinicoccus sp. YB14-2 TaxID=1572701 RepID=UPI000690E8C9|nr:hypothetical protein [Salinicoccus sp. YB14-2]
MHKSDIDKLEDMLINQEKYKKQLRYREMELQDTVKETIPTSHQNNDLQDPRTIRASNNTSSVESAVTKLHNDLQYQTLYSIVCNTPKFVNSLSRYEKIIYDYRYREVELSTYEWEDITVLLDEEAAKHNKSFSKSTTLRLRNRMLERYAENIGYTMM